MSRNCTIKTSLLLAVVPGILPYSLEAQTSLYSIGEPTAKEQYLVELINRARANPTAEGVWLNSLNDATAYPHIYSAYDTFSVNLTLMQNEFVTGSASGKPTLYVTPPLAINSKITAAARLHSQDQIDNDFQGHRTGNDLVNGDNASQRMAAQGYTTTAWGENAFASSYNPLYTHAGFQVDWGGTDGTGMQGPPRGHRSGIHNPAYREIGVGNLTSAETTIPSSNTKAKGPEVCTQDFATAPANTPFITGVAYYDLNGNSFYDPGEGVGGITVNATGASYHAVTSTSGGYAIPMSGNGLYDVSFTASYTSSPYVYDVTISSNENVKQDLMLTYTAPSIAGRSTMALHDSQELTADDVPGASTYTWRFGTVDSSPFSEDADQGSGGYSLDIGDNYTGTQTSVTVSGNAFRLVDAPQGGSGSNGFQDQILTLTRNFTIGASASVSFDSRVTWMYDGQHCKVQISDDDGVTWSDTSFDQAGTNTSGSSATDPGETTFYSRSVDLSAHSGNTVMIRFILDYQSGSILNVSPSSWTTGWYIDNITFSDIEEVTDITEETVASGSSYDFAPTSAGTYRAQVRADLEGGSLAYGSTMDISVVSSDFSTWVTNNPSATGGHGADPEGDDVINLLEYAFGLNPNTMDRHLLPSSSQSSTHFTMSATRPSYAHADLTYAIERSPDLTEDSWTTVKTFGSAEPLSYSLPLSSATEFFYRWKITLSP